MFLGRYTKDFTTWLVTVPDDTVFNPSNGCAWCEAVPVCPLATWAKSKGLRNAVFGCRVYSESVVGPWIDCPPWAEKLQEAWIRAAWKNNELHLLTAREVKRVVVQRGYKLPEVPVHAAA